jgi:hypothetical protein
MNGNSGSTVIARGIYFSAVVTAAAALAACGGSGIEGQYVGVEGDSLLESVTLGSDGVASVVYPLGFGTSGEGAYLVDGEKVTLTVPSGDKAQFSIDANGCLTHVIVGTYCRDGSRNASSAGAAPAAPGGTERYEATTAEGRISLELMAGGAARMTMTPSGANAGAPQRMSFDLRYEQRGGDLTIDFPGDGPTALVRSGRDLLMTQGGETARFIRQ